MSAQLGWKRRACPRARLRPECRKAVPAGTGRPRRGPGLGHQGPPSGALVRAYELAAALVLLVLVFDTEVVLDFVLAGLDLAAVLVTGLVVSELRGLVQDLVGLLVVLAGKVLGLVSHLTEVRHGAPSIVGPPTSSDLARSSRTVDP